MIVAKNIKKYQKNQNKILDKFFFRLDLCDFKVESFRLSKIN